MTAKALTIAGSDSGGGAGIQADLKTFSALGVFGTSAITAITAQNTLGVQAIENISPAMVASQIDAVLSDIGADAIKIGMVSVTATIEAIADRLDAHARNAIVDPVMVATSGDRLLAEEAMAALINLLIPRAKLVTPNLHEAALITASDIAQTEAAMEEQGRAILAMGAEAVLVKGGHGTTAESVDLLVRACSPAFRFPAPRIDTQNDHGTGCTLAAAITAELAKGSPLEKAIADAKGFLTEALDAGRDLAIGKGSGPVHHFHRWWG
ncbi:bifunctional hydroxymethylpyrimidine kinase/phosphomethylpyrimidine kinase [Limoniibacter endophyticus]|uniref:hydroxymethylpyrimidine kinase n=1 Tax=Limoniibacter endophyticus TaxID=1565040 RepID=A0A8J3GGA3_9HYPH|nr:bifunctional hydroxymethylpyrimidine kinase/phosphomethylpyrimidine kinase [Limoniibacter endophyticus]GHC67539.1 hydroxymethylpyrimidine/phosphomethylpyrimidine kinase [Limoniibacter endophyticus]